jgi:UDP-N-acetyl-D-glucosamine dehydrogenase
MSKTNTLELEHAHSIVSYSIAPPAPVRRESPLRKRIADRSAVVGIIGLGYVGLPLASAFSSAGFSVLGFDIDKSKTALLNQGRSYFKHIPSSSIQKMRSEQFEATHDFERLSDADVVILCVPTPLTESREPDLSYVIKCAKSVSKSLRTGQLVVLESTTYPGTTRDVVLPILMSTGMELGEDFFLAYSPEREDPGNSSFHTQSIPKVVGAIEPNSQELAVLLYQQVVDRVVPVGSAEVAEASKILENTYRAVNIALINELKVLFGQMGIDVWEVIEAAKTKPFGFQAFYPGPGLGGHCIPIDPFYLTWLARKFGMSTRFIELAGEINTLMPRYVVGRIAEALNGRSKPVRGSRILILGVAYKKDIDDTREAPALELMDLLTEQGAEVSFHDPYVMTLPRTRRRPHLAGIARLELSPETVQSQDCVVIVTDHSNYSWDEIVGSARLVVDTRNVSAGVLGDRSHIFKA